MKTLLSPKWSAIFVTFYMLGTLLLRFVLEPELGGRAWISLAMGAFGLLVLWALGKVRFLDFSFLFGSAEKEPQKQ